MTSPQITLKNTRSLHPHANNARTHSKKQIHQIANSIKSVGFASPIITDETSTILAGHGRWEAAKLLNLATVPVIELHGISEAKKRAFVLADNKLTENAGWDLELLAAEVHDIIPLLDAEGLSLELTGFDTGEIDGILGNLVDPEHEPEDDCPAVAAEAVTKAGDVWQLGEHRLMCGDARKTADLAMLMGRNQAGMVFTDPPYNVKVKSIVGRGRIKHREFAMASGEMAPEQFTRFLFECFSLMARHTTDGAIHFICSDWRHLREMLAAGDGVYDELKNLVVWSKTNAGQGSLYRSQHELLLVFKSGAGHHQNNVQLGQHGRNRSNVWTYPGANTFGSDRAAGLPVHPTVKPVAMVADAMRDCSARGDIILDTFAGSGTTILAAEKVGTRKSKISASDPISG